MIKVFTTNKDGKIELTKDELKALLDEAYWDGYRNNRVYVYNTPTAPNWTPYKWDITCSDATLKSSDIAVGTGTATVTTTSGLS